MKSLSLLKALAVAAFVAAPINLQAADAPKTAAGGAATGDAKSALGKADQQFVEKAAQSGLMEVQLGEVASQKASNAQVKEFGAMMVKDHGAMNQELKELAGKKGIALATQLDSKHQGMVDKLGKQTGEEFDKAYTSEMVSAHKKDVSEFEKASKSLADADLKAFAAKHLPHLQQHLQKAQELKKAK